MRRHRLAAGLLAVALIALTPSAAMAASHWFPDRHGDVSSSIDVLRVRLVNGTSADPAIVVRVVQRELRAGDEATVWFDTDPKNPGPEFSAGWVANSDSLGLRKVDSFADDGVPAPCPRLRVRAAQDDPGDFSRVWLTRRCLEYPDAVRVSVLAERQLTHVTVRDWAPSVEHFYHWVDAR